MAPPTNKIDLTGQTFGRLSVVKEAGRTPQGRGTWRCRCECGTEKDIVGNSLRSGTTRSCGCLRPGGRTHGMHGTRVYRIWKGIVRRTTKPQAHNYARYGGRGITICQRWLDFESFYADMGEPPEGGSIDRIDTDGPYSPDNCRWTTDADQRRNQRRSVKLTWRGRTLVAKDWATLLGLHHNTVYKRIADGWDVERALTTGVAPERIAEVLASPAKPS
ncbi:hypothetical protein [Streptomyces sp. NPDC004250]|uniref:hypothetical protein n=1 Tax=Streptomyces sp. NPDC004250 TaxID=3364692 RepID=UPI0036BBEC43